MLLIGNDEIVSHNCENNDITAVVIDEQHRRNGAMGAELGAACHRGAAGRAGAPASPDHCRPGEALR